MADDVVDLNEVLERVENDRELLVEIIEIFLEDYPGKMNDLQDALSKKDFNQTREIAHSLKGAAANISAKKIAALFLELEDMGKSNDASGHEGKIQQIGVLVEELKDYLAKLKQGQS